MERDVTEGNWLTSTDPIEMLEFLRNSGKTSDRKLRLFACACVRRVWHLLPDAGRQIVETAERYADEMASQMDLIDAHIHSQFILRDLEEDEIFEEQRTDPAVNGAVKATQAATHCVGAELTRYAAWFIERAGGDSPMNQSIVVRDIFGNPFRPALTFESGLRTPAVLDLTREIYNSRTFDRMPELAESLREAGCTDAEILAHFRSGKEHVRGCWVVDLILEKE
jgi:hypothetical protein